MSSAHLTTSDPLPTDLAALRAALDRTDDELLAALVRRAALSSAVGALAAKGPVKLRPGREAAILRRLLGQARGRLAAQAVVRIWRELLAASTAIQGPFVVSVCEAGPDARSDAGYVALAREQFGALTPLHAWQTPSRAIADVSAGTATVAVLPLPVEESGAMPAWWTALLHRDEPRIHVVARLPFWATRPEGSARVEALVVAASAPDPSGADRSLAGIEVAVETSRARLAAELAAAGFAPGWMILRREPAAPFAQALVELDGFVGDDDARLAGLACALHRPVVLGAYAVPLEEPA